MQVYLKELLDSEDAKGNALIACGVVAASVITFTVYKKVTGSKKKKDYPKNTIVVHGFGKGPYCPSLSPFVIKVETYLRINNIPYVADPKLEMGPKGKVPWIEYNGEVYTDSSFILKWCNKTFSVDLDKKLSAKEKGIARSIQKMVEENLFWCSMMCLFAFNYTDNSWDGFGWFLHKIINYYAKKDCWAQGMGRHTQEEVLDIMEGDIKALSNILGNQRFIMGDDLSEVDCCVFGFLCQLLWQSPEQPCVEWMKVKYPNLKGYCERMKAAYWKDWDQCITRPSRF